MRAIREREAKTIADRKQRLMSVFANVAELSAERMEELTGKATLRDAGVSAGIAVDKLLALTGQVASVQIANIMMPTAEKRAELRAVDAKLDAIAAKLKAAWETGAVVCAHTRPSVFLNRCFISPAVTDPRVISIRE